MERLWCFLLAEFVAYDMPKQRADDDKYISINNIAGGRPTNIKLS